MLRSRAHVRTHALVRLVDCGVVAIAPENELSSLLPEGGMNDCWQLVLFALPTCVLVGSVPTTKRG